MEFDGTHENATNNGKNNPGAVFDGKTKVSGLENLCRLLSNTSEFVSVD